MLNIINIFVYVKNNHYICNQNNTYILMVSFLAFGMLFVIIAIPIVSFFIIKGLIYFFLYAFGIKKSYSELDEEFYKSQIEEEKRHKEIVMKIMEEDRKTMFSKYM